MVHGKEAKNMGEISDHELTRLPAQEEKGWREGKMEITRSQVSQGPRGCSVERRSKDRRNSVLETLLVTAATQRGREFAWTAWDCCFPRFGCSAAPAHSLQPAAPFGSGKKGGDPKTGQC